MTLASFVDELKKAAMKRIPFTEERERAISRLKQSPYGQLGTKIQQAIPKTVTKPLEYTFKKAYESPKAHPLLKQYGRGALGAEGVTAYLAPEKTKLPWTPEVEAPKTFPQRAARTLGEMTTFLAGPGQLYSLIESPIEAKLGKRFSQLPGLAKKALVGVGAESVSSAVAAPIKSLWRGEPLKKSYQEELKAGLTGRAVFGTGMAALGLPFSIAGVKLRPGEFSARLDTINKLSPDELKARFPKKSVKQVFSDEAERWAKQEFGKNFDEKLWKKTFNKIWKTSKDQSEFVKRFKVFEQTSRQLSGQFQSVKKLLKKFDENWKFFKDREIPPPIGELKEPPKIKIKPGTPKRKAGETALEYARRLGTASQTIQKGSGWKTPDLKTKFDQALFDGDKKTVKKLLPDVPDYYKKQGFILEKINKVLGKPLTPKQDLQRQIKEMAEIEGKRMGIEPEKIVESLQEPKIKVKKQPKVKVRSQETIESIAKQLKETTEAGDYAPLKSLNKLAKTSIDQWGNKYKKMGVSDEEMRAYLEGDKKVTEEIKPLVKEYRDILTQMEGIAGDIPGETMGYVENWMPRRGEASGIIREAVPGLGVDYESMVARYKMPRTGKMKEYVDPVTSGKMVTDEVTYQLSKPYRLAQKEKIPLDTAKAVLEKADKIVKELAEGKFDKVDVIKKFQEIERIKAESRGEKFELKRLDSDKFHIPLLNYGFQKVEGQLKKANVFEIFKPILRWRSYASNEYTTVFKPLLESGKYGEVLDQLGKRHGIYSESLEKYFLQKSAGRETLKKPEDIDILVQNLLSKRFKSSAYDFYTRWLGTHHIEDRNLRELTQWMSRRLLASEIMQANTWQVIRQWVARGLIGLNIRPTVNNLLEVRRVPVFVNKKHAADAILEMKNPKNINKWLEKYGQKRINIEGAWENLRNVRSKKTSKLDDILFAGFNNTEGWKNAVFLSAFERQGKASGLKGKELSDFVMDNFMKYAHRGGFLDKVGIFRIDALATLIQFSEYSFKELWNWAEMTGKAAKGDRQAALNLGKKFIGDAIVFAIFAPLYGMTKREVLGMIPGIVDIRDDGTPVLNSPLYSFIKSIYTTTEEMLEQKKEGEPLDINKIALAGGLSVARTVVPGGSQLLGKTGRYALAERKGYVPSFSGLPRFPTPEKGDILGRLVGYTMGPFATKEARKYYKLPKGARKPLGKAQAEKFKEYGRDYYDKVISKRLEGKDTRSPLISLFAGKKPKVTVMPEEKKELPTDVDDIETLLSQAESTIKTYQEKKTKILYSEEPENLDALQDKLNEAIAMKKRIWAERPELALAAEMKVYSKNGPSSVLVEHRVAWAAEKLKATKDKDEFDKLVKQMLDADVLTKSVVDGLYELGINVGYYKSGGKVKKYSSGGKGRVKLYAPKPSYTTPKLKGVSARQISVRAPKISAPSIKITPTARKRAALNLVSGLPETPKTLTINP